MNFPLSHAVLKGKDVTFDKISFLDSSDETILAKLIKHSLRFVDQACGDQTFSEKTLRMMLTAKDTICAYATTVEGRITATLWGVKLPGCFFILFAAREPEYCGQHIYEKMLAAFQPLLANEEFVCWKQGKNNVINNSALEKLVLGDVLRSEGEAYTFESAEVCVIRLKPTLSPIPTGPELESALQDYAYNAGDLLTFAWEFPILLLKTTLVWNLLYRKQFPTPEGYSNSLQPV